MILQEKSIVLQSVADINELCRPLFDFTDITYFSFLRVYNDGSRACLTSHAERTKYLFEHDYSESTNYNRNLTAPETGFILWRSGIHLLPPNHQFLLEKKMAEGSNFFNVDHGIALFEYTPTYQDYYNFGTTPDNYSITDFYLSHMDMLNAFVFYFKDKAKKLIKTAVTERIIVPSYGKAKASHLTTTNNLNFNRNQFLKKIGHKRYFLGDEYNDISLTKREVECWIALVKGKSMKEAARSLNISPRTIETHLMHLKQKFDVTSLQQLNQIFWKTKLHALLSLF